MLRALGVALLLVPTLLHADPQLTLYPDVRSYRLDPGQPVVVVGTVWNGSGKVVAGGHLRVEFPAALRSEEIVMNGWDCAPSATAVDCTRAVVEPGERTQFRVTLGTPVAADGGAFAISTILTSDGDPQASRYRFDVYVARHFFVRTTADSGPESLRDVMRTVNDTCNGSTECKILFELPPGASATPVIELLQPLPILTAPDVTIGGNVLLPGASPFVELNGRRLQSGSGLVLRAPGRPFDGVRAIGMIIRDFPENAIEIQESGARVSYTISSNVLLDCFRGVSIAAATASAAVFANTIGGNARSGVAVWAADWVSFSDNFIGVSRSGDVLSNGASGIYVGRDVRQAFVTGGEIAFNYDFGVAIERGVRNAGVWQAAIAENLAGDLDWGLDGANPPKDDEDDGGPNPPLLLSATYDATTNTTTVTGELRGPTKRYGSIARVLLYASDMVRPSGVTPMTNMYLRFSEFLRTDRDDQLVTPFSMTLEGDYRGVYISGQTVAQDWPDSLIGATSELSRAIQAR